jgi:hypothetical protein
MRTKLWIGLAVAVVAIGLATIAVWARDGEVALAWDDGQSWGRCLRLQRRTVHEFAHYLNWNIMHASHEVQMNFERGFQSGFGRDPYGLENGGRVFDAGWRAAKAAEDAVNAALSGTPPLRATTNAPPFAPAPAPPPPAQGQK